VPIDGAGQIATRAALVAALVAMEELDFKSLDILEELQARLVAELEPLVRCAIHTHARA
jgi:hypothetical protein